MSARGRLRAGVGLAAGLLALGGCGSSSNGGSASSATSGSSGAAPATVATAVAAGDARTVSASVVGLTARLIAASHEPRVEAPWPVSFTVTRAGRPAAASVSYEYLFGGQVVARRSHYVFTGHFADVFKWPASAVGYPLTFRAVIASGGVTINLDYPVQVRT